MSQNARTVAVLGLGKMGSAIADAVLAKGHHVTVWNRSPDKASKQVASGAALADTPTDAVQASEIVLVCVIDTMACKEIFACEGLLSALTGKTLIQLSTMTPEDSRGFADCAAGTGANYLDGSILGLPQGVRDGTLQIIYSGPKDVFTDVEPVLTALGKPVLLGEQPGTALLADKIVYTQYYSVHYIYLLTAALGKAAGISVEVLKAIIGGEDRWKARGQMIDAAIDRAARGDYSSEVECALDVHLAAFEHVVQISKDMDIGTTFTQTIEKTMKDAIEKGHAKDELAAIFEVLCEREK